METRRTKSEAEAKFRAVVASKGGEVLGEYVHSQVKVRLRCSHGHEWDVTPNHIVNRGTWCPTCHGKSSEAAETKFRSVVSEKGGEVVGEYVNSQSKVRLRCSKGHEWQATPNSIVYQGSWCPTCAGQSPEVAEAKFRAVVASKGGEVLGAYVNAKNKVRLRCAEGHEWMVRPAQIVSRGTWCPTCGGRTPEGAAEKLKRIVEANGGMVFDEYAGSQVKLRFRCRHGHEWRATPNSVISGTWCRKCSRMKLKVEGAGRPTRPSPKVEAQFRAVVAEKGGEIVGEYLGTAASVRLRCRHGHEWEPKVTGILYRGCWCPHCSRQSPEAGEARFRDVVADKGGMVLSDYVNMRTKVGLRCRHGHEWEATPTSIIQGNWCPTCYRNSGTEKLRDILDAKGGRMIGDYAGSQVKVRSGAVAGMSGCPPRTMWSTAAGAPNAARSNGGC